VVKRSCCYGIHVVPLTTDNHAPCAAVSSRVKGRSCTVNPVAPNQHLHQIKAFEMLNTNADDSSSRTQYNISSNMHAADWAAHLLGDLVEHLLDTLL
jgi:hypothetical protein